MIKSGQQFFYNLSIRRKLVLVTLLMCGISLALACGALFWFQSYQFRKSFTAELESQGAITAQYCVAPLAFNDPKSADALLAGLKIKSQIVGAYVFDANHQSFGVFRTEEPNAAMVPGTPDGTVAFADGYAMLRVPITDGAMRLGTLHLRANYQERYNQLVSLYASVMAVILVVSGLVLMLLSSVMQRLITAPIVALAKVAQNITESQNYSSRASEISRDEVGRLTNAFNKMLDQIEARDVQLRGINRSLEMEVIDRKAAQAAQARLTTIIEATTDFVSSITPNGSCLYVNHAGLALAGFNEQTNVTSLKIPDFHPQWATRIILEEGLPAAARLGSWTAETAIRRRDGREIPVSQLILAHRGANGAVEFFSTITRDITDRKQKEEDLQRTRRFLNSVLENLPVAVFIKEAKNLRFVLWNKAGEELLGITSREMLGKNDYDFFPKEEADLYVRRDKEALAGKKLVDVPEEVLHTRHRGARIMHTKKIPVFNEAGESLYLLGITEDITERKEAEAALEKSNKELLKTTRLAGMAEVATGVLHNVGNVLNSVNVSVNLIVDQVRKSKTVSLSKAVQLLRTRKDDLGTFLTADPKGKQIPAFLEAVSEQLAREHEALTQESQGLQQNIEHIKQIVITQQSYAKVSGVLEKLSIHEVVEDALRISAASLTRHEVTVLREFAATPAVLVDRHKVLQILVNLIGNAKQAMDKRERDRRLTLRIGHGAGSIVRLEVTDNGMGIAPENLTKVFQHGFTTKETGHGFGLHSGANAAKEMGGSLTVHSDGPGCGATFVLDLPCAQPGGVGPNKTRQEAATTAVLATA